MSGAADQATQEARLEAIVRATPGLMVSGGFEKMGLRTSPIGEIALDDCHVPAESRLGPEGAGMAIFNSSMEWERSCIFASVVGAMRRQLDACVAYARSREQFGQPIGKFQGVSNKLADMYVRLEAARLLIYRVAWLKQQGRSAPAEAAFPASSGVVTVTQTSLPALLRALITPGSGQPKVNEMTGSGSSVSKASLACQASSSYLGWPSSTPASAARAAIRWA